jgi:hypothetical protein
MANSSYSGPNNWFSPPECECELRKPNARADTAASASAKPNAGASKEAPVAFAFGCALAQARSLGSALVTFVRSHWGRQGRSVASATALAHHPTPFNTTTNNQPQPASQPF